jgi:diaminopimelate epimerase
VRDEVGDADGILEIRDRGDDWVQIAVWNPDGSLAEMSGNGTRIAARWLAERTSAAEVTVWVGAREVKARMLEDGLVEQTLGPVEVGKADVVEGIRFTPVDVGNPHAVVEGDPADLDRIGPLLETHPRFPNRTNVQVAHRLDQHDRGASLERGVGDRRVRHERDRDRRGAQRTPSRCGSRAAISTSGSKARGPPDRPAQRRANP